MIRYTAKGPHKKGCALCGVEIIPGDSMVRWMYVSPEGPSDSNIVRAHETCEVIYAREEIETFRWGEAWIDGYGDAMTHLVEEAALALSESRKDGAA